MICHLNILLDTRQKSVEAPTARLQSASNCIDFVIYMDNDFFVLYMVCPVYSRNSIKCRFYDTVSLFFCFVVALLDYRGRKESSDRV